ncbi:MAG: transcription factor TFIIIB component B'' homolog [archaeon]|nr:transcription factor TFIIIB component B'' homolog [archaeon]
MQTPPRVATPISLPSAGRSNAAIPVRPVGTPISLPGARPQPRAMASPGASLSSPTSYSASTLSSYLPSPSHPSLTSSSLSSVTCLSSATSLSSASSASSASLTVAQSTDSPHASRPEPTLAELLNMPSAFPKETGRRTKSNIARSELASKMRREKRLQKRERAISGVSTSSTKSSSTTTSSSLGSVGEKKVEFAERSITSNPGASGGGKNEADAEEVFAPQLMVNEDGSISINPESMLVSPSEAHNFRLEAPKGHRFARSVTPGERWSPQDTRRFYTALQLYGTDFTLLELAIPHRCRRQLKNKFKREERDNPSLIANALSNRIVLDEEEVQRLFHNLEHQRDPQLPPVQLPDHSSPLPLPLSLSDSPDLDLAIVLVQDRQTHSKKRSPPSSSSSSASSSSKKPRTATAPS